MDTSNASGAFGVDANSYIDGLQGAEIVLRFLGNALGDNPGLGTIQLVRDPDSFEDVPFAADNPDTREGIALLAEWRQDNSSMTDEALRAQAEETWFRICSAPGKAVAPPWQSYYTDEESLLFAKETLQVRKWYRKYGLQSEKLNQEPDDHIAIMLSFLAYLAREELKCLERDDIAAAAVIQNDELAFLSDHVLRFIPEWSRRIVDNSGSLLYSGLALMALGVVNERHKQLASSPWLESQE